MVNMWSRFTGRAPETARLGALARFGAGLVAEAFQMEEVLRVHAAALQDVQNATRRRQPQHALQMVSSGLRRRLGFSVAARAGQRQHAPPRMPLAAASYDQLRCNQWCASALLMKLLSG